MMLLGFVGMGVSLRRKRRTHLFQCFGFDLANTLTSNGKFLPNLFEGVALAVFQAKAELEDAALVVATSVIQPARSIRLRAG